MEQKVYKTFLKNKKSSSPEMSAGSASVVVVSANNKLKHQYQSLLHQQHHLHHNTNKTRHRVNNCYNHPNNNTIAANAKSYASTAIDQLTGIGNTMISTSTKNEEAIQDLRQRIPDIENIFDVHSRIGNGTFSTVLLGTLKKDRELPENIRRKFAIKHHIPTSHPDRIIKELKCMVEIGGIDNVVGINCTIRHNESVAFIMPYMPHDRFHDFFNKMELTEVQCYMKNLFIALRRVHKFNVIHRDVKPSNFLYNRRRRQFLLVDFGLAQQMPQLTSMATITGKNILDGKRLREHDDGSPQLALRGEGTQVGPAEVSGSVKRLRSTGPYEDQQVPALNASTTVVRMVNSCALMSGSPFKMPLKQLNEISTPPAKTSSGNTSNTAPNTLGIYSTPLSRQVKSAILGATLTSRLQQKTRQNAASQVTQSPSDTSTIPTSAAPTNSLALQPSQPTNRNLTTANASKCCCYGNPQVCNICLIKKEIHASRAGTPGYRPPEVLLKYPDQTTAVDIWASGVIFLSILSSVYPFFKAPNDYVALAEMVTIFGDKTIRKTAFVLDRLVTLSQKTKPLDLRKLCVRFRNRSKFSSPELLRKYESADGTCEVCKNCDQFYFNCLCSETHYSTEPFAGDDPFPGSAYDLLYKLLEVNPHKRITAEEALEHPFFQEVSKEAPQKSARD